MAPLILLVNLTLVAFLLYALLVAIHRCWVRPRRLNRRLDQSGFRGPPPSFPFGNIGEMRKLLTGGGGGVGVRHHHASSPCNITHDVHALVFPYFAKWRKSYGNVFTYWLGTEPFVYVAEPEFIRQILSCNEGKSWGKPSVFREDRKALFGNGLLMLEGAQWSFHRNTISSAFFPSNLRNMSSIILDSTGKMLDSWDERIKSSDIGTNTAEIDVEKDFARTTADIISKITVSLDYESQKPLFDLLCSVQKALFKNQRLVGVPFGFLCNPKQSFMEIRKLGSEIDGHFRSIIRSRRACRDRTAAGTRQDLLDVMLMKAEGREEEESPADSVRCGKMVMSEDDLVNECKTMMFSGHETTSLALSWTMFLLGCHQEWQQALREEITEVAGGKSINANMLSQLTKMTMVMNEVLRLYSPAPNVQREAKEDLQMGNFFIPKGTNIWVDIVGMNHDPAIWGDDVNEFRPDRFQSADGSLSSRHKMEFVPFGFGGRICVGQNVFKMEYKLVLSMILGRFSWSVSPNYSHSPAIMLSLRPSFGIPLIVRPLNVAA